MQDDNNSNENSYVEKQYVIFKIGTEEFGVEIMEVKEIIRMEDITKMPNCEGYIEGVINLRGGIVVIINLAMKLNLPIKESDKNTRIIVIENNGNTFGMVVDAAQEVMSLKTDQIKPPPSIVTQKIDADYIQGVGIVGERLLILLDLARVMGNTDLSVIKELEANAKGKVVEKSEEPKAQLDDADVISTDESSEKTNLNSVETSPNESQSIESESVPEAQVIESKAVEKVKKNKSLMAKKKISSKTVVKKVIKKPVKKVATKLKKSIRTKTIRQVSTKKVAKKAISNKTIKKVSAKKITKKNKSDGQVKKQSTKKPTQKVVKKSVKKPLIKSKKPINTKSTKKVSNKKIVKKLARKIAKK